MLRHVLVMISAWALVAWSASAQREPGQARIRGATPGMVRNAGPGAVQRPAGMDPAQFARQFDKNQDGKVTRAEAGALPAFARMDQNNDGVLSPWEIELAHLRRGPQLEKFIQDHDQDGSGGLTTAELPVSATRFAQMDANGDKQVNAAELEAISAVWHRGEGGPMPGAPDRPADALERAMARWDANHDGKITTEEFGGAPQMW